MPARPRRRRRSYWSRQPSVTAWLICSSSRRSVSAGSAWVDGQRPVVQRQRVGQLSRAPRPPAPARAAPTPWPRCRPPPSPPSSARAATWPALSSSPRYLWVRPASTSSRARCRADRPGDESASFQRGQGLRGRAGQHAALGQRPVQVDQEIGLGSSGRAPGSPPARPRPRSPMRYRASASRLASQPCRAESGRAARPRPG